MMKNVGSVLLVLLLLGCPQESELWLAPDATVDDVEFLLGLDRARGPEAVHITLLRVDECDAWDGDRVLTEGSAVWFINRTTEAPPVARITYGEVPPGFDEFEVASPLEIGGCYVVVGSATSTLRFHVERDGRLVTVG